MKDKSKRIFASLLLATCSATAFADYSINYEGSAMVNAGSGNFAPYYIASNADGVTTQNGGAIIRGKLWRPMERSQRFSYSFGIDAIAGWTTSVDYMRWNRGNQEWQLNPQRPGIVRLQQLFGEVKYRSLFLTVGMKQNDRSLFDSPVTSGDITISRNARPIPQVEIGFIDFQNIPLTQGWVQIRGDIAYGKFADANWIENHYNYYNSFITTGVWFHHKSLHLRTNPSQPFSVTVGMQHAAQFGGSVQHYREGEPTRGYKNEMSVSQFLNIFLTRKGDNYYEGNSLGSWDLRLRYRLPNQAEITAYMQSPWEDGSGIGKLNGWDGVWGISYKSADYGWIEEAAIEYLDFTNQSGPMHWAPGDSPGTSVTGQATGGDDYYNNFQYDGWANYGMSIGTPFLKSPLYNTNGYPLFTDNRARGFHLGVAGHVIPELSYRLLCGYRTSWGTPFVPAVEKRHDTSALLEGKWQPARIKGLTLGLQLAFDAGSLYGNQFGASLSASYSGLFTFKSRKK